MNNPTNLIPSFDNGDCSGNISSQASTMKAIINNQYGPPSDLQLADIKIPRIGDHETLIRVHATGLHIGDCFAVRGSPFIMRLHTGLFKPTFGVPGFDVAGTVEAVGKDVTRFKKGDEVFGECDGACAEFARVSETRLSLKPASITFEQAAAIPTSALAALHAMRDVAEIKPGDRLLVNGAAGGVGCYAVQLAKIFGAHVTAICSSNSRSLMVDLGADQVIDYNQQDFTQPDQKYDVIFDNVENRSLQECRNALTDKGLLILNSGTGETGIKMLCRLFKPLLLSPFTRQNLRRYLSVPNHSDLEYLCELVETGKIKPVIDRTYPLSKTSEALEYIEEGHTHGKVIVSLPN
ncbi:MAG: NADPH:quinone reductase-like Zn-dependent oxidoreductase [Gammaproteobacteria bacterium]|jgi:NADPH:quinone reductase-like Zn-dependent oxidoreductase